MSRAIRALPYVASIGLLFGCSENQDSGMQNAPAERAPQTDIERPDALRLPPHLSAMADCAASGSETVSAGTWVEASDDVIVGTVVDFWAAWEPLWRDRARGFVEPETCAVGRPALEILLTDVESLLDGDVAGEVVVRIGVGAWQVWGNSPVAAYGSARIDSWALDAVGVPPPLHPGMRLGAAVYTHDVIATLVTMAGRGEPLFEVVDGNAWFQATGGASECSPWSFAIDALNGLPLESLSRLLRDAAAGGDETAAQRYRDYLGLDTATPAPEGVGVYAARCRRLVDEEQPRDSPAPCESNDSCEPFEVCSDAICVPRTTGWEHDSENPEDGEGRVGE
jgi:hypothetical protein